MYDALLQRFGFTKHGKPTINATQCWIKTGKPDINVDTATGLWASEYASDHDGFGNTAASLEVYLYFEA